MPQSSEIYDLVLDLVEQTDRSVFITGRAGTGKTTMLHKIVQRSKKQTVVVAPTGVAAINASGATIHSFFMLPPASFPPTDEERRTLLGRHNVRQERIDAYRELELLIIDEISMVRADVLDAIDAILCRYRGSDEPFGGVQVVMFGDLYQLPPVVKGDEAEMLKTYYKTPNFFSANVIAKANPIVAELDTIFRQTDADFISLLNDLRNNTLTDASRRMLESRLDPDFDLDQHPDYIYLTAKNEPANRINSRQMEQLEGEYHTFKATVKNLFPEAAYPIDETIRLKKGAKVMFVVNERGADRRYYNGMIGKITALDRNSITVETQEKGELTIVPHTWENIRYNYNDATKEIETEVAGTYSQFPLRPAWAITIHKSQGLTFDHVAIDSADAFAHGQTYVAFSRCRTLEGITLTSKVNTRTLAVDYSVCQYCNTAIPYARLLPLYEASRTAYRRRLLADTFNTTPMYATLLAIEGIVNVAGRSFTKGIKEYVTELKNILSDLTSVSEKFRKQLQTIDEPSISARVQAAAGYFLPRFDDLIRRVLASDFLTDSKENATRYLQNLDRLHYCLTRAVYIITNIQADSTVANILNLKADFSQPEFTVRAYSQQAGSSREDRDQPNPELFRDLVKWRADYCEQNNMAVYTVLPTRTLRDIAAQLPVSEAQLRTIKGFGKVKIIKYGADCIDIVKRYCRANNINYQHTLDEQPEPRKPSKQSRVDEIAGLIAQHNTVEQIAEMLNLKRSTIMKYVAELVGRGTLRPEQFVDPDLLSLLLRIIAKQPDIRRKELFDKMKGAVPYEQIDIAFAHFAQTQETI